MDRKTKEAIRYLGYGKHKVEDRVLVQVRECFEELSRVIAKKSIYRTFDLEIKDHVIRIGTMEIKSRNLEKNLIGCESAVVFGATLGTGVDRLMHKYTLTDMSKAVILQACAAADLEEYCDSCQDEIVAMMNKENKYVRPRFSPGYGDFDIRHQADMIRMLELPKTIGLTMTDSYMLTPVKSVTAVMGISSENTPCHRQGCESCQKKDCAYRRET